MSNYYGVLIDTTSIQQYVFSGNRLKENLGASFLIQDIYKSILENVIVQPNEKGFIGGGNALLFFKDKGKAKEFIKEWTRRLLIDTPGLTTAVAISEESIPKNELNDSNKFKNFKNKLSKQLKENKNSFFPQVVISSHGITADCKNTGLSMDDWIDANKDSGYYSSVSTSKLSSEAMVELSKVYPLDDNLYTNDLGELGSSRGEDSHIAIVHIDGNDMGKRFEACDTLKKIEELSETLKKATEDSLRDLLNHIKSNFDKVISEIDIKNKIIPIRPIIIGGDDITFVCDGRLGIYFAKIFLEAFESKKVSDEKRLTACAGVAIIKLKYPFNRGYKLAEELCSNAKQVRKNKNDDDSWIDFHIAYGGISAELKEIREKFYKVPQGNLLNRPYKIVESNDIKSFVNFVKNTKLLYNDFPNSKIKDLREVLNLGQDSTDSFANELNARGLKLPTISNYNFESNLFQESITPYFDMIELTELYPSFKLKRKS